MVTGTGFSMNSNQVQYHYWLPRIDLLVLSSAYHCPSFIRDRFKQMDESSIRYDCTPSFIHDCDEHWATPLIWMSSGNFKTYFVPDCQF
jgi:hypothetical protein